MIPTEHAHTMMIDTENGNKKWHEAETMELTRLEECNVLIDAGTIGHFIYGIKPDGRHKARYVTRDGDHGRDDQDEKKGE